MNDSGIFDLIESFLNDLLSPEEKAAVEEKIRSDARFSHEVAAHLAAKSIIVDNALLDVKKKLQEIHAESYNKTGFSFRNLFWGIGILIIGLTFFMWPVSKEKETISVENRSIEKSVPAKTDSLQNILYNDKIEDNTLITNSTGGTRKEINKKDNNFTEAKAHQNETIIKEKETVAKVGKTESDLLNESQMKNQKKPENHSEKQDNEVMENNSNTTESPCFEWDYEYNIQTVNTCENQKNGRITFIIPEIENRHNEFSIDGGNTFYRDNKFINLSAGSYILLIKDELNCRSRVKHAKIEEENCHYIIHPQRQIFWDIPLNKFEGSQVILVIRNGRTGDVIFQRPLPPGSNSFIWPGTDQNDRPLPMGTYVYELSSGSSEVITGQITIVN